MQKQRLLALVLGSVGSAFTIGSVVMDGQITAGDLGRIGGLFASCAFVALMWAKAGRPVNAAYELGQHDGYDHGFEDGYRAGRRAPLTIVPPRTVEPAPFRKQRAGSA